MRYEVLGNGSRGPVRVLGLQQAFKLFRALKQAGVETSFVAIPVEGHFPGDPVRTREVLRRWVDWLAPRLK